jgi:flagellar basal-body rod protein FlgG
MTKQCVVLLINYRVSKENEMSKIQAVAALGMQAHQLGIETIANNIANINTSGYKSSRVNFQHLLSADSSKLGVDTPAVAPTIRESLLRNFEAGKTKATESPYDVAIQGAGFLAVLLPDGTRAFHRGGTLRVNADLMLTTAEGWLLEPPVRLPANVADLIMTADGKVLARAADQVAAVEVGQLELANFANPGGLQMVEGGLYLPTESSGEAVTGRPGEAGLGMIAQRRLESSNVNMMEEMVTLMTMQQAYGMLSRVLQADEELKQIVNNLRKSS